ncbi:odorant receptor 46a-like [Anticarsia gemmatalis]|uniref:odorant receptor 46a-like n=1 Tax=Anticarsia gemmatalis TaxID=129554 RepID=UPI003F75F84E
MEFHQIDCFKIHFTILKFLGVWPSKNPSKFYVYYSLLFVTVFVYINISLYTINFFFLPQQLDIFAEETIFYFMDLAVVSKVLTFIFMRDKIRQMLDMLESEIFQANTEEEMKIIEIGKQDTLLYWKITAGSSVIANGMNVLTPLVMHIILRVDLEFPVCRYSFIPEEYKPMVVYPAYVYQGISITSHMLYNVQFDCYLLGVMFLAIAQLDILDKRLRRVTDVCKSVDEIRGPIEKAENDLKGVLEINKCIKHYDAICNFCKLIQDAFSETLFIQFALGSCKTCVCLFRFTLPATYHFLTFLFLYMIIMILQIMVPCWFGSKLIEKSSQISFSVYDCDWTVRCRRFNSNLRLLVERAKRPLTITGGQMFLLSLKTFTTIMNSAYSFFTLLRHMRSR